MEVGDLVWVKMPGDESSSTCYWPGLIRGITRSAGVWVSFFDRPSPSCFRISELRPFADRFVSSLSSDFGGGDRGAIRDALLDRALRWLCRRTALSLRCRCGDQSEVAAAAVGHGEAMEVKKAFRAEAVVEFVRSKAVSPWVEVGDFVAAVRSVAQVQVFRNYNAVGQRSAYRKMTRRLERGTCLADSQSYPSSNSTVEELCNLELGCENLATHNQLNKIMKADAVMRMNPSILPFDESYQPLGENKLEQNLTEARQYEEQSVNGMLVNLRCLALDSSSLEKNCLDLTEQIFLRFRNFLFEKVSGVDLHKCSPLKGREASFSNPCFSKAQHSTENGVKKCESEVCCSIVPYVESPVRSLIKDEKFEKELVSEMLVNLKRLGLDSSSLQAICLNVREQAFIRCRSFLFEKVSDIYIRQCSPLKTRESYFSNPCYITGQHSIEDNKKKCDSKLCSSIVPHMETPVRRFVCKRQLDLPEDSNLALKLCKTIPIFSINRAGYYQQISRTEAEVDLSNMFLSYNGIDFSVERSGIVRKETSIGNPLKLEIQNSSGRMSTYACNGVLFPNTGDFSLCKKSNYRSNVGDVICKDQVVKAKDTRMSHLKLQNWSVGILDDNRMSYVYGGAENRNPGVQNAEKKSDYSYSYVQSSAIELTLSEKCDMFEANASDIPNVDSNASTEVYSSECHLVFDQTQMLLSGANENAMPVKSNGKVVSLNLASEEKIKKIEKLNSISPCASGLLSNSCQAQQSKAVSRLCGSTSLHMKFPKDMNLPSKEKLVKKFGRFGPIDSLKTKIFWYTGSAQVVFFKQLDAMAAYQYARRRKLLPGQPNVRYWLDPFDDKRGANFVAKKPSVSGLKSCLRNSNALEGKVKKKHQKVRFLMET